MAEVTLFTRETAAYKTMDLHVLITHSREITELKIKLMFFDWSTQESRYKFYITKETEEDRRGASTDVSMGRRGHRVWDMEGRWWWR
jgi:hypothetical protein